MPNTTTIEWVGVPLPAKWAKDYASRSRKSGLSIGREVLLDIAKARAEAAPIARKAGRPRKRNA